MRFYYQVKFCLFFFIIYSHQSQGRLSDLVAEHLDHLHYLNDILCLEIGDLNCVLTDQLLHRLLLPLYVLSLAPRTQSQAVAQSQVFTLQIRLQ